MKSWLGGLLLALVPLASASGFDEVYTARTTGSLTIDEQGAVLEVELDDKSLGQEVMAAYARHIRDWRFEPVLEQGQPIRAKGYMQLDLLAFRRSGSDDLGLGVSSARFTDPPSMQDAKSRPSSKDRLAQPRYPHDAAVLGIGADVMVLVRVGEQGRVEDAAVASLMLVGERAGEKGMQKRHGAMFNRSATDVARRWTFAWAAPGETLKVPIRYTPPGYSGRRWVRAFPVGVDAPAWVLQAEAASQPMRMAGAGQQAPDRLRLVTRLDAGQPIQPGS